MLWIQQAARAKWIEYLKVPGEHNPADMLTKHLAEEPRLRHATRCHLEYLPGRPAVAPQLCANEISSVEVSARPWKPVWSGFPGRSPIGKGAGGQRPRPRWADLDEHEQEERMTTFE